MESYKPINRIEITGRADWEGYCCYHLYRDRNGNLFKGGKKMCVIFHHGRLVGEYNDQRAANIGYINGDMDGHKAGEYLGLCELAGNDHARGENGGVK